jgi:hypothetical protein
MDILKEIKQAFQQHYTKTMQQITTTMQQNETEEKNETPEK